MKEPIVCAAPKVLPFSQFFQKFILFLFFDKLLLLFFTEKQWDNELGETIMWKKS